MREEHQENKILMITYAFPSIKTISSIRNYNIAQHFLNYFSSVRVLTTTNRRWFPKENFPFDEQLIYPSPTLDYRTIKRSKKSSGVNEMPNESGSFLVALKDSFPFNLIIGLGGLLYIFCGVIIGIYLVKKHKITHLFSSFKPYSDHVIAWWLKLFFPSLVWIADYNNLHIMPGRRKFWLGLQRWFDNLIASKANLLTTVSEGLVEHLEKYNQNIYILENGMMRKDSQIKQNPFNCFSISYTGSLYPEQSPATLLKAISELINSKKIDKDHFQLIYAGASSNLWNYYLKKEGMESFSKDLGVLSLDEANQIQANSHLNLLLTWRTETLQGIIPAKFYDYLHSKKNILMIARGGKDWVWEKKFKELKSDNLFYDNEENLPAIKSFILKHYENWKEGKLHTPNYPKEVFKGYYWDNLMKKFVAHLEKTGLK